MKIEKTPPQTIYKRTNKLAFTANQRAVLDELSGDLAYRNNTWFFRHDIGWNKFADFLIGKYKKANKVNIYCYACSEGAEPFSLAMLLIKKLGLKKAQKFFPIMASDIDEEILKNPRQGIIRPSSADITEIKKYLRHSYSQFIEFDNIFELINKEYVCKGQIKPLLANTVNFKLADIRTDIQNVEKDNSIIMCRNFWNYLPAPDRQKLAKDISNALGDNSMCIIGDFDRDNNRIPEIILNERFSECETGDPIGYYLYYTKNPSEEELLSKNPEYWQSIYVPQ